MKLQDSVKLCPNFKVFAWNVCTNTHELVFDDPEASIVEINEFIAKEEKDCYYAIYQKNHYDDELAIVAMIPSKKLSEASKLLGFTALHHAKKIEEVWWFR